MNREENITRYIMPFYVDFRLTQFFLFFKPLKLKKNKQKQIILK